MSTLFEAENLQKNYDAHTALFLPYFHMERGEVVALTGHNGCGKSTLLRLLAFLERPTSGVLQYTGNQKEPRKEITLLLQAPYLMKDSVFRNVTLGLCLRNQRHNLPSAYTDAMHAVGFKAPETLAGRAPHTLSGGERQRVALAARLILNPAVLLLDEPTSNVDAESAQAIIKAVEHCLKSGCSVVCATHDRSLLHALHAREINLAG